MHSKGKDSGKIYDIIIIGGGPAGLTAGLYASRARMDALLVESFAVMGQATMTEFIENYPGVEKATGFDLISTFKKQAQSFGLICTSGTVKNIFSRKEGDATVWQIEDENGIHQSYSIIIASGASSQKLGVPGENEFLGRGVSYCATCDGAFFREKDIVVVGGGDTAVEEALFLTKFGKKVTIVHRRDRLRAAKILQERAFANEKIEFAWDSVVAEIAGKGKVEKVVLKNVKTDKLEELPCDGVFVFVGWNPNTGFAEGTLDRSENGGVIVDTSMKTSQAGVFSCGDCCAKILHQVVTACGDGAVAAYSAQQYVDELKGVAYK